MLRMLNKALVYNIIYDYLQFQCTCYCSRGHMLSLQKGRCYTSCASKHAAAGHMIRSSCRLQPAMLN